MHRVAWAAVARREMDRLADEHPGVAAAVVELVYGGLAERPTVVGKPLRYQLEGLYSARRGEYRVLYRIESDRLTIVSVGQRGATYRPR